MLSTSFESEPDLAPCIGLRATLGTVEAVPQVYGRQAAASKLITQARHADAGTSHESAPPPTSPSTATERTLHAIEATETRVISYSKGED